MTKLTFKAPETADKFVMNVPKFNYIFKGATIFSLLQLAACSLDLQMKAPSVGSISGAVILPSGTYSAKLASSSNCSPTVTLYSLDSDTTPIHSTALAADGSFKIAASQLNIKDEATRYQLVFNNCSEKYSRVVTGTAAQNISLSSDLMAQALNMAPFNSISKTSISKQQLESFTSQLQAIEQSVSLVSLEDIYLEIKNSPSLASQFNAVFGFPASRVEDAPPKIDVLNIASSYNEGSTFNPTVTANHWYSGYDKIYKWELDNTVLSQSPAPATSKLIPANSQGPHRLKLTIGRNNGAGLIDNTKPTITKSFDIQFSNTILPTAPDLAIAGNATLVNSPNLSLQLSTGSSLINCESFTALALTEGSSNKPSNEASYTIHCTQPGTQIIPYTLLSTSDGPKTLRLWAIDGSGTISANPGTVTITLDRTNPTVSFGTLTNPALKGGAGIVLNYSASDSNGIASLQLKFSTNGTDYTHVVNLDGASTNYLWSIPTLDVSAARLQLVATDNAGNTATATSEEFSITSIPPNPPSLTLNTPIFTQSTSLSITNGNCNKSSTQISFTLSPTAPLLSSPNWQPCTANGIHNFTITSNQGTHNVFGWLRDAAGNVSSATSLTVVYDTLAPSINLISLNSGVIKGGSLQNIQWSASDAGGLTSTPIEISYSTNGGSTWSPVASSLGNSGSYTWTVPSIDSNTVKVRVTATDSAGVVGTATSSGVVAIDSTAPALSLSSPAGGEIFGGSSSTTIQWIASDANMAALPMSFEYSTDGSTWTSIASDVTNSGSISWSVPLLNSSTVKVRATAVDQVLQLTRSSSANFTVDSINPSVTLTSLNGGSVFQAGSTQNITWTASDVNLTSAPISLDYSCDSGSTWINIASNLSNSSSPYPWILPVLDASCKVRVTAKDQANNAGVAISSQTFDIDNTSPSVAITSPISTNYYKGGTPITINWTAADTHMAATPISLAYSMDSGGSWVSIADSLLNTGSYLNWTLPVESGTIQIRLQATDATGNVGTAVRSFTIDNTVPTVSSVAINDGDTFAQTIVLNVKVGISDNSSGPLYVQLVQATGSECPAASGNWIPWVNAQTGVSFLIPPTDGTVKICAWAKDTAGNVSVISPDTGTLGVDYNTIEYRKGTPPTISGLSVTNSGTAVTLIVNATDDTSFGPNSVTMAYSTDGTTWMDTSSNLDISIPANITWQSSGQPPWTFSVTAPSTDRIQYRVIVKDPASNTSLPVKSQILNEPNWSIYAGNVDVGNGLSGTSTRWQFNTRGKSFAVNPLNNDIYFIDNKGAGIRKYSAKTGLVTAFINNGTTTNLGTSGTLTSSTLVAAGNTIQISIDKNNKMYMLVPTSTASIGYYIYRINLSNNTYTRILGGGTNPTSSVPSELYLYTTALTVDDENSLYFFTYCMSYNASTTPTNAALADSRSPKRRLVKVTQDANGNLQNVITLAGNCSSSSTTSGSIATDTGLVFNYGQYSSITTWENGKYIYLGNTQGLNYKIINGTIYSTGLNMRSYEYNPIDGHMYATSTNAIYKFLPKLDSSSETVTKLAGLVSNGNCTADNISIADACISPDTGIAINTAGNILFADGVGENRPSLNRLRLLTSDNKVTTLFGTLPFNSGNDQLDRALISGSFKGIYYKKSTEPNSAANEFPEGLYFTEADGMVLGRIDPVTNKPVTIWGNQYSQGNFSSGQTVSASVPMGSPYAYGSGYPLYFDTSGTPWIRSLHALVNISKDKVATIKTNYTTRGWHMWDDGTAPANVGLATQGGKNNLTAKGTNFFLIGDYWSTGTTANTVVTKISYLDFTNNNFYKLMGSAYVESSPAAASTSVGAPAVADVAPGNVVNTSLPNTCSYYSNSAACYIHYDQDTDRLYYSENTRLRYIATPTVTSTSSLHTLFTASVAIRNFIFSTDKTKVWWLSYNGTGLYCTTVSGTAPSWCNGTTNHYTLSDFSTITPTANQMTWMNDTTLMISTGNGLILKFNVPTGP